MAITIQGIGALVSHARIQRNLTQAELATLAGVSRKWLNELERGKPEAQLWKVIDVLAVLGYGLEVEKSS